MMGLTFGFICESPFELHVCNTYLKILIILIMPYTGKISFSVSILSNQSKKTKSFGFDYFLTQFRRKALSVSSGSRMLGNQVVKVAVEPQPTPQLASSPREQRTGDFCSDTSYRKISDWCFSESPPACGGNHLCLSIFL